MTGVIRAYDTGSPSSQENGDPGSPFYQEDGDPIGKMGTPSVADQLGCYWNWMENPRGFLQLVVVLLALFTGTDLNNFEYVQT